MLRHAAAGRRANAALRSSRQEGPCCATQHPAPMGCRGVVGCCPILLVCQPSHSMRPRQDAAVHVGAVGEGSPSNTRDRGKEGNCRGRPPAREEPHRLTHRWAIMEAATGSVTGSGSDSTSLANKFKKRAKCGVTRSGSENTVFTRKLNQPI